MKSQSITKRFSYYIYITENSLNFQKQRRLHIMCFSTFGQMEPVGYQRSSLFPRNFAPLWWRYPHVDWATNPMPKATNCCMRTAKKTWREHRNGFIDWVVRVNWPPLKQLKDDVSSVSPSSRRIALTNSELIHSDRKGRRAQHSKCQLSKTWGPFLESPENFSGPKSHLWNF